MRISDWSSDVCSSDLDCAADPDAARDIDRAAEAADLEPRRILAGINAAADDGAVDYEAEIGAGSGDGADGDVAVGGADPHGGRFAERRSEERRVGTECVSTFSSQLSPDHSKTTNLNNHEDT